MPTDGYAATKMYIGIVALGRHEHRVTAPTVQEDITSPDGTARLLAPDKFNQTNALSQYVLL